MDEPQNSPAAPAAPVGSPLEGAPTNLTEAPTNTPAPPPVATAVAAGERTEREVDLEAELAAERARHAATATEKKARELRLCELEDELQRLKSIPAPVKPAKVKRKLMFTTVLDDEEGN